MERREESENERSIDYSYRPPPLIISSNDDPFGSDEEPKPKNSSSPNHLVYSSDEESKLVMSPLFTTSPPTFSFNQKAGDCDECTTESKSEIGCTDNSCNDTGEGSDQNQDMDMMPRTLSPLPTEDVPSSPLSTNDVSSSCSSDTVPCADDNPPRSPSAAMLDAVNTDGLTALSIAAQKCFFEGMRILISNGADINNKDTDGLSPLHYVCTNSHLPNFYECVKLLLASGADVNTQDNNGKSPLHIVTEKRLYSCIELLLAHGACVRQLDFCDGNSPLHIAARLEDVFALEKFASSSPCLANCTTCCVCNSTDFEKKDLGNYMLLDEDFRERGEYSMIHKQPSLLRDESQVSERNLEIWTTFFQNAMASNENEYSSSSRLIQNKTIEGDKSCSNIHQRGGNDGQSIPSIDPLVATDTDKLIPGHSPDHGNLEITTATIRNDGENEDVRKINENAVDICLSEEFSNCFDPMFRNSDNIRSTGYMETRVEYGSNQQTDNIDVHPDANLIVSVISAFISWLWSLFLTRPPMLSQKEASVEEISRQRHISTSLEIPEDVKIALERRDRSRYATSGFIQSPSDEIHKFR